ncbi:MAG TPA: hypothetical protein VK112_03360 [Fodinibius sp.]|nr:hypothetical protein [Fodinibius sp.]
MKKLSYAIMIAILLVGMSGCGDDSSTGPGTKDEAPTIPELSVYAQPDITFFENNQPPEKKGKAKSNYSNYSNANFKVTFGTLFASMGQIYLGLLGPAYNQSPDFKDGRWVWSYDYSADGESISIRYTAKEQASSIKWQMFMSGDFGEGSSFNDYKLMEGTTRDDGTKGNWTFNVLNDDNSKEVPAIKTEWNAESDTERTISTGIYGEGSLDTSIDYDQSGVEHTMTIEDANGSEKDIIFWNTDTKTGYVIDDGTKMCWDENLANIPC